MSKISNFEKAIFWINYSQSKAVSMEHRRDAVHLANIYILRSDGIDEKK